MRGEGVLFVYYSVKDEEAIRHGDFSYRGLPGGWYWVGGGRNAPIGLDTGVYEREDQFGGPWNKVDDMLNFIKVFFKDLKNRGILKLYKIAEPYQSDI